MSKGDNSPGVSKFAGVLKELAKGTQETSLILDFGVIQSDKSLLTNTYPISIPQSDYLVCGQLKKATDSFTTSYASISEHGDHRHTGSATTHDALSVGDRVLVAWVLNDAVVIDKIYAANQVF